MDAEMKGFVIFLQSFIIGLLLYQDYMKEKSSDKLHDIISRQDAEILKLRAAIVELEK